MGNFVFFLSFTFFSHSLKRRRVSPILLRNPAENFTVRQKLSYVMLVDQDWIIGTGIYNPTEESAIIKAGSSPQVREKLKSFVEEAVEYARIQGRDAAITEYNNRNGTFNQQKIP